MTDNCLLLLHAHPDDEVFSTGGIIARYARAGDRVVVVYGTRGEQGEMHDPDRDPAEATPRLGEIREAEAREALAILGATDVYFLGYRDSGMKDTDANQDPANFMNAPLDEATDRLLAIMREVRPQVVVTYDENGGYGHPDHVMTHKVAVEASNRAQGHPWAPQKLYLSARSREAFKAYAEGLKQLDLKIPWLDGDFNFDEYGVPESELTAIIDISAVAPLKKRALAVHRTQIPSDFFYLRLPDNALSSVAGKEFFQRVSPPPRKGEQEDDLFAGVRDGEVAVA
jgi:N-acetyl-1-D-myo-inositol-2-amino-2-deoxy-alpha-D-glucopyranoside deacetylase/mycothiol S-conjugate amidase